MLLHISEQRNKVNGAMEYVLVNEDSGNTKTIARMSFGYGIRSRVDAMRQIHRYAELMMRAHIYQPRSACKPILHIVS